MSLISTNYVHGGIEIYKVESIILILLLCLQTRLSKLTLKKAVSPEGFSRIFQSIPMILFEIRFFIVKY